MKWKWITKTSCRCVAFIVRWTFAIWKKRRARTHGRTWIILFFFLQFQFTSNNASLLRPETHILRSERNSISLLSFRLVAGAVRFRFTCTCYEIQSNATIFVFVFSVVGTSQLTAIESKLFSAWFRFFFSLLFAQFFCCPVVILLLHLPRRAYKISRLALSQHMLHRWRSRRRRRRCCCVAVLLFQRVLFGSSLSAELN